MSRSVLTWKLCLLLALLVSLPAQAVVTTWTVQSSSSAFTITGSLSSGGTLVSQVASSNPTPSSSGGTQFTGTLTTQQSFGQLGYGSIYYPEHIEILSAQIDAPIRGDYDPLPGGGTGTAPADSWMSFNLGSGSGLNVATRDLAFSLFSDPFELFFSFPGDQMQIITGRRYADITSANMDYRGFGDIGSGLGSGTVDFADEVLLAGYFGDVHYQPYPYYGPPYGPYETVTLRLGLDFTLSRLLAGGDTPDLSDDVVLAMNYNGVLTATAPIETVPEANGLVLLGLSMGAGIYLNRRRRRERYTSEMISP